MNKTFYGKDKGGKYKVWTIEVVHFERDFGLMKIAHGQEGGKMTLKSETFVEGKQGRNGYEQAVSEAEGRIKKQVDKGYRENKVDLEELPVLPMLAGDYNKIGHRINYEKGVYLSDKLDGVRLMAKCSKDGTIKLESRTGQPYDLPHIAEELKGIMQPGDILDGEAYLHGYALQDITSAVKRTDTQAKIDTAVKKAEKARYAVPYDDVKHLEACDAIDEAYLIHELRPKLQFVVFAVIESETVSQDLPFSEVVIETYGYRNYRAMNNEFIKFIHYELAYSEEEMKAAHKDAVKRAFEGIMIRNADGVNESGKRSADLQKYKEFVDAEFEILDVLPAKDDGSVFLVQNDINDLTFTVAFGTMAFREQALKDKEYFISKFLNVKFQSRYKGTLLPQFPTGEYIREGKMVNGEFVPNE
jgi:DNA ligase-1